MDQLGDFRISAVLGQGGSGVVYDAAWGPRRVALKVLHATLVATDKERAQFFAEAERLQRIAHPSVVKVLAVGALPDGRPYLAMERLEGETLASLLARGAMAPATALPLFEELCAAVGALHDQQLIHRDLKPENVFVVAGQHAVLLDFGIAKELNGAASTVTQDGGVRGTPAYMAPERFFGQAAGVATDVYELAVIFYAMLAGRLPWEDLFDPEARLSPRPLDNVAPALDIETRRAMSTRPQNRPVGARELYAALATAAGAEPKPGDTAPLRSGELVAAGAAHQITQVAPAPMPVPPPAAPWFADRQPTTDRGRTPLAWAPTEASPASRPAAAAGKRWPLVVGAVLAGAAMTGGGVMLWNTTGGPTARTRDSVVDPVPDPRPASLVTADAAVALVVPATTTTNDRDPWGEPAPPSEAVVAAPPPAETAPAAPTSALVASEPELSVERYRAEAIASLVHLPADTKVVMEAQLGELRRQPQLVALVRRGLKDPRAAVMFAMAPPCLMDLMAGSEWATFGSPSLGDSAHATLIIRGRWTRGDVASCFKADAAGDGVMKIGSFGLLTFIDDRTALITNRKDLTTAQLHALAAATTGGAGKHARALYAALAPARSLAFAIDGGANDDLTAVGIPRGSDLSGWLRALPKSVEFDVGADTHDQAAAKVLEGVLRGQLQGVFPETEGPLGHASVSHEGSLLRVRGVLTDMVLAMIASDTK